MLKKVFYVILLFITNIYISNAKDYSSDLWLNWHWLPWTSIWTDSVASKLWWNLVSELIKYVAVIAVIAIMCSGIMYLISGWQEEKVKKAKTWIIYSLVWVFLSISALAIIKIINNISI